MTEYILINLNSTTEHLFDNPQWLHVNAQTMNDFTYIVAVGEFNIINWQQTIGCPPVANGAIVDKRLMDNELRCMLTLQGYASIVNCAYLSDKLKSELGVYSSKA